MQHPVHFSPDQTLSDLAVSRAGASRVFHRHGLDYCCHGRVSLREACASKALDVEALIAELEREEDTADPGIERWSEAALEELVDHILSHYHEPHRAELPRLVEMARKVERVHADKPTCPHGLADLLVTVHSEMEDHMAKEEQVLFPMIRAGMGERAAMPIHVMEREHEDHGKNLARLRELAHDYEPPAEACGTWRALYLGLARLEQDLMDHISLENNVLFPRALRG